MIDNIKQTVLNFLGWRRRQYLTIFMNEPGKDVLADLAKFCRAGDSTFHEDPRLHALLEGRREVFLRIANHLKLTDEELYEIYARGKKTPTS